MKHYIKLSHAMLMFEESGEDDTRHWMIWCLMNVGDPGEGWWWYDMMDGHYVSFNGEQDAVAFKLAFGL